MNSSTSTIEHSNALEGLHVLLQLERSENEKSRNYCKTVEREIDELKELLTRKQVELNGLTRQIDIKDKTISNLNEELQNERVSSDLAKTLKEQNEELKRSEQQWRSRLDSKSMEFDRYKSEHELVLATSKAELVEYIEENAKQRILITKLRKS